MKDEYKADEASDQGANDDWWHRYVDSSELPQQESKVEELPVVDPWWRKLLDFRPSKVQVVSAASIAVVLAIGTVIGNMAGEISHLESVLAEKEDTEAQLQERTKELRNSEKKAVMLGSKLADEKQAMLVKQEELEKQKLLFEKYKLAAETEIDHWKKPMSKVLGTLTDVYSMKLAGSHPVYGDFESGAENKEKIQACWEDLAQELSLYEEYRKEEALLRAALLETYAAGKMWSKIKPDAVGWKAAGKEHQRAMLLTKVYYCMAMDQLSAGKKEEGMKSLDLCRRYAGEVKEDDVRLVYTKAMIDLLEGRRLVAHDPSKALKHYKASIEGLDKVVVKVPASVMVRSDFSKACRDGLMLSMEGNDAAWGEQLQKQAKENAAWLVKNHPEVKLTHLMSAELDVAEAEKCVRIGRVDEVEPLLKRAEKSINKAGGDILLESSVEGVRAFVAWNKGYITKAKQQMQKEINNVGKVVSKEPRNVEARYRLSSLLWERSSMHADSESTLKDGMAAAEQLRGLINDGAGAREASVRRMAALVLSDVGYLSAQKGNKSEAKKCFDEARRHWSYLRDKWGDCREYREGERWCTGIQGW